MLRNLQAGCGGIPLIILYLYSGVQSPLGPYSLSRARRSLTWQGRACREEAFLGQESKELGSPEALALDRARSHPRIMKR